MEIIVLEENYGFTGGYNRGLALVDANYFVILNSDVEIKESWIEPIVDLMESDSKIAACQPKILSLKNPSHFEYAGAAGGWMDHLGYPFCRGRIFDIAEEDNGQYNTTQEVFWATGAAMICQSEVFTNLGGFDESYFAHMEEIDLCWRMKNAGYTVMVEPSVSVFHLGGGTLQYDSPNKIYYNFRNNLYTLFKNEKASKLLWLFPLRLILDGVAGVQFISKGKFQLCLNIIYAHISFYKYFFRTLRKRKANQQLIAQHKIGAPNHSGKFGGSIILNFFLKGNKTWNQLFKK